MENTTKHMVLSDGVAYVEANAVISKNGVLRCDGCEFFRSDKKDLCTNETSAIATQAFGGHCVERGVIYIKADPQPQKAEG